MVEDEIEHWLSHLAFTKCLDYKAHLDFSVLLSCTHLLCLVCLCNTLITVCLFTNFYHFLFIAVQSRKDVVRKQEIGVWSACQKVPALPAHWNVVAVAKCVIAACTPFTFITWKIKTPACLCISRCTALPALRAGARTIMHSYCQMPVLNFNAIRVLNNEN